VVATMLSISLEQGRPGTTTTTTTMIINAWPRSGRRGRRQQCRHGVFELGERVSSYGNGLSIAIGQRAIRPDVPVL
jgi:hypothetical protein